MKHLKKINEFNRTIGFRYSEPKNKFKATFYCVGNLTEDSLSQLLSYLDIKHENISIRLEDGFVTLDDDQEVEFNVVASFDFAVYSEQEMPKIMEDIRFGLMREFEVDTLHFEIKELPRLAK